MSPIQNQLKNINPTLIWQREEKITKTISYLEEKGFEWEETKKIFYNRKLGITINSQEFGKIIEDYNFFQKMMIERRDILKNRNKNRIGDINAAGIIINFLVFLIIVNLFLGWIIFSVYVWFFLEIIFVFFLFSFIKIRNKIKKNVN